MKNDGPVRVVDGNVETTVPATSTMIESPLLNPEPDIWMVAPALPEVGFRVSVGVEAT